MYISITVVIFNITGVSSYKQAFATGNTFELRVRERICCCLFCCSGKFSDCELKVSSWLSVSNYTKWLNIFFVSGLREPKLIKFARISPLTKDIETDHQVRGESDNQVRIVICLLAIFKSIYLFKDTEPFAEPQAIYAARHEESGYILLRCQDVYPTTIRGQILVVESPEENKSYVKYKVKPL